jgi:predicted metal-dependent enzyme (double-stranded beta helix superfamily)
MGKLARFQHFVQEFTLLLDAGASEERIFSEGKALLASLIAHDDWLPDQFARAHPDHYQNYLLHCDPLERFSVVSFVWGPGQTTPVHDHTVWGMVGVMRGADLCEEFDPDLKPGGTHRLSAGAVDLVSPLVGDIHRVSNALSDAVSLSIHVYGANIGKVARHAWDLSTGERRQFVSAYSDAAG